MSNATIQAWRPRSATNANVHGWSPFQGAVPVSAKPCRLRGSMAVVRLRVLALVTLAVTIAACSSPPAASPKGGSTTVPSPSGRCDVNQTASTPHVSERPVVIKGARYYRFVNEGTSPCRIEDAPVLQMIDAAGRKLPTSTYIVPGGAGPSLPRRLITLVPGRPVYLLLFDLKRAGFGARPPKLVCPTSSALEMTFPGSSGMIKITGPAGRFAPYVQLGGKKVGCGRINMLPLSSIPSDVVPT